MRSIPQVWRQAYIAGNQNYKVRLTMTLVDGTNLTITNDNIWEGGFSLEEGTSDQNSLSIGSAIIGKCTVVLNNISEEYSSYNFFNAEFDAYLNMDGLTTTDLRIGHYTVDETSYNGSLITLIALDNMWRFDRPFSDINFTFTAGTTARDVINAMCQYSGIGITLATQSFQGYNFVVAKPEQELNCREVLQHLAQATCNYCKMDEYGNLRLLWYDKGAISSFLDYDGGTFNTNTTPYSDGCNLDGGRYYRDGQGTLIWEEGDEADGDSFYDTSGLGYITNNYSMEVGTDNIMVTGVKICTSNQDNEDAYDYSWHDSTLEQTHPRYTLVIQDNVFITKNNAQSRTSTIGGILAGLPLRSFTASSVSDISIEAGDPVAINDFRGNRFYSFVTNVKFQTNNQESFSCGVESITQNKVVRYSNELKTLVEAQRNTQEQISTFDQAVTRMNNLAVNAMGAYEDYEEDGDARIYYLSNKPISKNAQGKCVFTSGSKVYKITGEGFFVSQDAGVHWVNGYNPSTGELVINLLNAIGINAEWINAGSIDARIINVHHLDANNISSGTISCNMLSGGTINGQSISGGTINGTSITGASITSEQGTSRTQISGGNITSNNVNLTGTIHAKDGTIGSDTNKWNIGAKSIYNGCTGIDNGNSGTYVGIDGIRNNNADNDTFVRMANGVLSTNNVRITGGTLNVNGACTISAQGVLHATGADIQGTITTNNITATGGNIGGCTFSNNKLQVPSAQVTGTFTAAKIETGNLDSSNYNNNGSGGYSAAGTRFDLDNGAIKSKNFKITSSGDASFKGEITSSSGEIGPWTINSSGLSNSDDGVGAWIKPLEIACGAHGATLVKMIGKKSGSGYLSVEVNADSDYVRVYTDKIQKKTSSGTISVKWDESDRRLKKNIEDLTLTEAVDLINSVLPRKFEMKDKPGIRYGFIAQEVREVLDDNCAIEFSTSEDEDDYRAVHYDDFVAPLCMIVKEQQAEIDLLKQELAELKERIN